MTHDFKKNTYMTPTFCASCNNMLMGVMNQGYKCRLCSMNVHKDCRDKVAACPGITSKAGAHDPRGPMLVFVNPKSGGCAGQKIMDEALSILGPQQVFDLTNGGPRPGLQTYVSDAGDAFEYCRVLACGGDGTVGWVLSVLDEMNLKNEPSVGILPLGTGNDLARVMGWGGGYTGESFGTILRRLSEANAVLLDRWMVKINDEKPKCMNNYFSIGIDAEIATSFHNARNANPEKFNSQVGNKVAYAKFSMMEFAEDMTGSNQRVSECCSLEADGCMVPLRKQSEGIIVSNIPSYAGGADLWGKGGKFQPANFSDTRMEVVTVDGVAHLGALQTGLQKADRVAQCSKVKIRVNRSIHMQLDGEPWFQEIPEGQYCDIEITHFRHSTMLKGN